MLVKKIRQKGTARGKGESVRKGKKSAYAESVPVWFERYRTKPQGALNGVTLDQIRVESMLLNRCFKYTLCKTFG